MKINLDNFRDSLKAEYEGTILELPEGPVELRNTLRLTEDERAALIAMQVDTEDLVDDGTESMRERLVDMVEIFVGKGKDATRLLDYDVAGEGTPLRDDLATLVYLVKTHAEGTQLGEA